MRDRIIDQSLIDYLALGLGRSIFVGKDKIIVPNEQTHSFILNNHDIGTCTREYYYTPTSRFVREDDFQSMVKKGFVGKKETAFEPYPFIFYGAYVSRNDLLVKLNGLDSRDRVVTYKGKEIKLFGDLYSYYEDYAEGFKKGFENFEERHVTPYTKLFTQDNTKILKVFEYVTKEIWFKYSWYNNHRGFTVSGGTGSKEEEIIKAYEQGEEQGYYYKAWSIILSNKDVFEQLFENLNRETKKIGENSDLAEKEKGELIKKKENIDWIETFNEIDVVKEIESQTFISDSIESEKDYFKEGAIIGTLRKLHSLKKKINCFNYEDKLEFINSLTIPPQEEIKSKCDIHNQTEWKVNSNYYKFIKAYKIYLENETRPKKIEVNPVEDFASFFDLNEISLDKIKEIHDFFRDYEGKYIAALIDLLKSKHKLIEIIPSSRDRSLKKFHTLLTNKPKKYEAVRKCFDEKNNWNYSNNDEQYVSIEEKLNKILQN